MPKKNLFLRLQQRFLNQRRVLLTSGSVAGFVILLRLAGVLQSWELAALDQLFGLRPIEDPEDRILIVEIDESDIQNVGKWPIPDGVMAELLQKISVSQPRAIGLDIYRDLPVSPGHEAFVVAMEEIPNLIGIEKLPDSEGLPVNAPPTLREKNQVGFNNVDLDVDNKVRRYPLYWHINGEPHTSLSLQLAFLYLNEEGIIPQAATINPNYLQLGKAVFRPFKPNDGGYIRQNAGGYQILANYRHPSTFTLVSMSDVLAGNVPPSYIRDRVVLIGSTAPSIKDFISIPYNSHFLQRRGPISGVEAQANFTSQIISSALGERPLIKVWSEQKEWLWILGWSVVGASLVWRLRSPLRSSIALLIASCTLTGIVYTAFLLSLWIPLVPPLLGLTGSAVVIISYLAYQEEEFKRSKEFLQTIIDKIPDPIFVKNKEHHWMLLNQAFCELVGYPVEALLGKSESDILPPDQATIFHAQDQLVLETSKAHENEEKLTNLQGVTYEIATKRSLHKDAAGNLFLVGVIRDITERKRVEEELRRTAAELSRSNAELKVSEDRLRYLANHDPLTGLANRKLFLERLTETLIWAQNNEQRVGLLFLDLNGFKQVNDTLGHDMGDLLLKAVAKRLTNCLRSSDVVSRLGGDEFTVILPGIKQLNDTEIVSQKIISSLSQPFMLQGKSISVSVSIGSSIYPDDGENEAVLIKKADKGMYQAKELSRQR
ncbi:MAG: CHASE2 domain-containing protein [Cyanobacteriota bacterium]